MMALQRPVFAPPTEQTLDGLRLPLTPLSSKTEPRMRSSTNQPTVDVEAPRLPSMSAGQ